MKTIPHVPAFILTLLLFALVFARGFGVINKNFFESLFVIGLALLGMMFFKMLLEYDYKLLELHF